MSEEKIKFISPTIHAMFFYFIDTDEEEKEPAVRLSGELSGNRLIMSVTMATSISLHVKDKNSIFTARGEDMTF